ncbi:MAG TPA: DUF6703 family protein [Mycobacteriales bacterium]
MPPATPPGSPLRARIEARSAVLVAYLSGRRALVFVLLIAAVIGFLVVPGPLSLLVGVPVLAAVGWLSYLSWPHVDPRARAVRAALLVLVTVVLIAHASG